ncbi:nuclear transport factor 2 family protein [Kordiimonas pumila]|uniref:Nuclear transport factor 2 family protein n=1 Tax=Kordiimonas pumila TaxID=2161677 RepID=A0ABV7D8B1_9PROT|nr:nuclear transport factor 2 family protein [Kordiimonas pumila]
MANVEKNLSIAKAFWDSIRTRNIDAYSRLFTKEAIAHDPANKPSLETDKQRRVYISALLSNFEKLTIDINFMTPCGDYTASKWTANGITGEGQQVVIEGIDIIKHADNGLIEEMWGYFDN